MAVLWQRRYRGVHYQVRSAGASRRLYTDGIFHSQFNPRTPLTGSVWDLLTIPAFFLPPGQVQRVLLLGVGGGAVIRQLSLFVNPRQITGVDLDGIHLRLARRFFGVPKHGVSLCQAEAGQWLQDYDGPPFDMVIDDLFWGHDGVPGRTVAADRGWFGRLLRVMAPDGVLAMNFAHRGELQTCGYFSDARLRRQLPAAFRLQTAQNDNAVGVFLRVPGDSRTLRRHLRATPGLEPGSGRGKLHYSIRRLWPVENHLP